MTRKMNGIDLAELLAQEQDYEHAPVTKEVLSTKYTIDIDTDIVELTEYRNVFKILAEAKKEDVVVINIASDGGHLDTGVYIAEALKNCPAKTIAEVKKACSAATLIMLACDYINVLPCSYAMFHTFTAGNVGKGQELKSYQNFNEKHTEGILKDFYKDFLTSEELTKMLDGSDLWFSTDELKTKVDTIGKLYIKNFN